MLMQPETPQTPQAGWAFHDEANPQAPSVGAPNPEQGVVWTASEYISHGKSNTWYIQLGLVTAAVTALAFLITKDFVVAITLVVVGVIFGVAAGR